MNNPCAVLYAISDLRIEDRNVPVPGPGQVQVAIQAIVVADLGPLLMLVPA